MFGDDAQTSKRVGRTCRLHLIFNPVAEIRSVDRHIPFIILDNDEAFIGAMIFRLLRAVVWSFKYASMNLNSFLTGDNDVLPLDLQPLTGKPLMSSDPVYLVLCQFAYVLGMGYGH